MRYRVGHAMVVAWGAWALAAAACAAGAAERQVLTGSDSAVWLVRWSAGRAAFDVALRKSDGDWQWLHEGISGRPAAAVAAGNRLHVLFTAPADHVIFGQDKGERTAALAPDTDLWPAGASPVAACEAIDPNTQRSEGIVVVLRQGRALPAAARVATAPASAPASAAATFPATSRAGAPGRIAGAGLRVLTCIGSEWRRLADWPDAGVPRRARILAATFGGSVHVLIADLSRGANRMARWDGLAWRDVPLAGEAASAEPVAMLNVRERPVLLLARPAGDAKRRELLVAMLEAGRTRLAVQPMVLDKDPATWPAGRLPLAGRLGEQIALVWQDANSLQFGTCAPQLAQLMALGRVDVFDHAPPTGKGEKLFGNFLWVVLLAVLVPLFLFRPRGVQGPFELPEAMRTGPLGKRLLAAVLDFVPVYLVVNVLYAVSPWALSQAEVRRILERMWQGQDVHIPVELAVTSIAILVLYVAYGTVMELRGQATLGKRLMKLRVVGSGGHPPGLRQCLLRNLLKIVELVSLQSPLFFLVPLVPLFTRHRQRLGDLLARTAVVDARPQATPTPPTQPPGPPSGPGDRGDPPT